MSLKPTAVPRDLICSVCGLEWSRHSKTPKVDECIELLKRDLAAEKARTKPYPYVPYIPYVPYPRPVYPTYPNWWYGSSSGTDTTPITVTWNTSTTLPNNGGDNIGGVPVSI